jgi:hypothetical protein
VGEVSSSEASRSMTSNQNRRPYVYCIAGMAAGLRLRWWRHVMQMYAACGSAAVSGAVEALPVDDDAPELQGGGRGSPARG